MITVTINNFTMIEPLDQLPWSIAAQIRGRLTFLNPAFQEAQKRGFSTWNIPQEIRCCQLDGDRLIIPRGATRQVLGIIRGVGLACRVDDHRRTLAPVEFTFRGEFRNFQETAVEAMAARDFGTLSAPTGSGKTVVALALIARRRQPVLVVCHSRELLDQWVDRIGRFLGIQAREIGVIGGGKMQVGGKITVGLVQSLYKFAGEVAPHIGHLVVDECHRAPSRTFTEAVTAFDCRFMTGLSATPWRRDGLSRLIYWHLGDKAHEVDKAALVDAGHVPEADVIWRETNFRPTFDPTTEYPRMLSELTTDQARNALIVADVAREAGNGGGVCLVLSDRKSHCQTLVDLLAGRGITAAMLTGNLSPRERRQVVEALNGGKVKVLVATGALIGEGFDCRELSTLFLVSPIRFNGRLLQYLGRVLRPAPGKEKARVFDYLDPVGVLEHAARARSRVYGGEDHA